jgi:hypothetical protein
MSQQALDRQHDEIKERNRQRRLATMQEAAKQAEARAAKRR